MLKDRGEAMLGCRFDPIRRIADDAEVLGVLEPGLSQTLEIIRARGQLSLADLRESSDETKPTTWSNRIASLIRQGFVVPFPKPNKKVYRVVLA